MSNKIGIRMVLVGFCLILSSSAFGADWYRSWGYRQQVTIYGNQVSGTEVLTNFPVLITQSNVQASVWQYAQASGNDILFTAADGVTKLPHELEKYDVGSTQLCAWVQIPRLSSASNTIVYMYYGRPNAVSQQDAAAVWADYRATWHMGEASGTRYDSTSNDVDEAAYGGVSYATGVVDGATAFDGSSGYLNSAKKAIDGNASISMWLKMPASMSISHNFLDASWSAGVLIRQYHGFGDANQLDLFVSGANVPDLTYFSGMAGNWVYLTWTLSNGTATLYRNGQFRRTDTYSGTPSFTGVMIGSSGGSAMFWNGGMDEMRISKSVNSAAWIATEYNNQTAQAAFAGASAQESMPMGQEVSAWYGGWGYRQKLVVISNLVSGSGTLTNFPVLIMASMVDSGLWAHAKSSGDDVVFTAADGRTKIPHEFEVYNAGSSQLCAWVLMPQVTSASNTSLYVYYGNPAAANQQNAAGVWADYRAVWHLGEASGTRYDSSGSGLNATPTGTVSPSTGQVNGAAEFDGSTGKLTAGQAINGNGTLSLWVWYPAAGGSTYGMFDTSYATGILLRKESTAFAVFVVSGAYTINNSGYFTGMEGQWIYVTLTVNNGDARLYRNGVYRINGSYTGTPGGGSTEIGHGYAGYWPGREDEVRVCTQVRSDVWLATEYNDQTSPSAFAYNFSEERKPSGTIIAIR